MAQFFKPQPKPRTFTTLELVIDSLDLHGVGVARDKGKAIFVEGAMPGERVRVRIVEEKKQHAFAQLLQLLEPSAQRQEPFCPNYAQCGGCSTQHLSSSMQLDVKVDGVRQIFRRLSGHELGAPDFVQTSATEKYRRVCRLSIKYDKKARCARLGFRRRLSHELVEVEACPVLASSLSALIVPLRQLCNRLKSFRDLGHIELCESDDGVVLLVRHNGTPSENDLALVQGFAQSHHLICFIQTEGEPRQLTGSRSPCYRVDGVEVAFAPGDFLQVNRTVNEQMVAKVLEWLAPVADDKVLDLFCGLGNFTLPIAKMAGEVVGVEGVLPMVHRARENAERNGLTNVRFFQCDLAAPFTDMPWAKERFGLVLLDPARPGAAETIVHLLKLSPRRLVYVSCNPVTAARDSQSLLNAGYRLTRWGLFDMFPHTGHVETILLFEKLE